MKAVTREKYGRPDVLLVQEIEKPSPSKNEVLVRVHCATVNRTDCGILTGKPYLIRAFTGIPNPSSIVPGTDFAGEVVEVGPSVKDFKVGDRVWGLNDEGLASQAEYMTINENKGIAKIPDGIAYSHAVASAEGAHYALNFINKVTLKSDSKVLVNGATGAIGSAAVQILKSQGIYVTAVGNTKNLELIKSLGADKVFDYEKEDFTEVDDEVYDFVFDAVGKSTFDKSSKVLKPKGTYISSELGPNAENLYLPFITKIRGGRRVIFPIPSNRRRSILYMTQLLANGAYKAVIDRTYPPEDIREAYEYVRTGQKTGNVVIEFAPD